MAGITRRLTTVAVVALSGWSCGATAPEATPGVAAVVVTPATSTLAPNAQFPLRAEVQDGSGAIVTDAAVTWTVQDPRIVSISEAGVVTALAVGTSQVAASSLGKSGIAIVTVKAEAVNPGSVDPPSVTPSPVASVTVTAPAQKVKPGSSLQLIATAVDANGNSVPNQTFYWSSSNTSIATVSGSGVVTGKRPGKATITAQTSSTGGKSGALEIEVK
jgi:uncharacterized protein YjdB